MVLIRFELMDNFGVAFNVETEVSVFVREWPGLNPNRIVIATVYKKFQLKISEFNFNLKKPKKKNEVWLIK